MRKIKIPIKYKEQLEARFDPKNLICDFSTNNYYIRIPCPLCEDYGGNLVCSNCPFREPIDLCKVDSSCGGFVEDIIGLPKFSWTKADIIIHKTLYNQAVEQLIELRSKAKEYIEWV